MNQIFDYLKTITTHSMQVGVYASISVLISVLAFTSSLEAQQPTRRGGNTAQSGRTKKKDEVKEALKFTPKQKIGVRYDIPTAAQIENCKIESAKEKFGKSGYVVYDPAGRIIRKFVDTGGTRGSADGRLDQWSYYKDGVEVYRDIDSNFNGSTDQYRWFGPDGGTRWGIDNNEDGTIDSWKQISASEVVEELFYAIRQGGGAGNRSFRRLLLTEQELKQMQLGQKFEKKVAEKLRDAATKFNSFASSQRQINSSTKWNQFSTARPNVVPAGTDGLKRDILIYNLASGLFTSGRDESKFGQLSVGTLIEVSPNKWRLTELPEFAKEKVVVSNGNLFYPPPELTAPEIVGEQNTEITKLFAALQSVEEKLKSARTDVEKYRLEKEHGQILLQLALKIDKKDGADWVRQLTDAVCNAYTTETYPDGLKFLESSIPKLKAAGLKQAIPYVEMGILNARFSLAHSTGNRKQKAKANERYNDDLERFAKYHPRSEYAADALLQLGLTADLSGDDPDAAIEWYKKCRDGFPNLDQGKRAAGALQRLVGIGQPYRMAAKQLNGKPFDLQSRNLRGKVIAIHFWETSCDQCIDGFEELQRLNAKYNQNLIVLGANVDPDINKVKAYLAKNRNVNWPQLHSPGELGSPSGVHKSPLAIKMGVATLPLTLLIDQDGKLVEGNIHVDELEREVQRLLKKNRAAKNNAGPRR